MDTGQDIVVPDEMSIIDAEALQEDTQGRFSWVFTSNNFYIKTTFRNYIKPRKKDVNKSYPLLPIETKIVRII